MKAEYKRFILRQSNERRRSYELKDLHHQLDTAFKKGQLDEEFGTKHIGDMQEDGQLYSARDVVADYKISHRTEEETSTQKTDWELLLDMLGRSTQGELDRQQQLEIAGLWGQAYGVSEQSSQK